MIKTYKTKRKIVKKDKSKVTENNISEVLKDIGMSQQELADITRMDTAHLCRIIKGKHQCISLPIALKISKALGLPVEKVFYQKGENEKKAPQN